jgi:hypothetical protein
MIPYILHVAVLLAASFLFYKLLLQKETFYRLNRWVLLLCLVCAFALPLLPVPAGWSLRSNLPAATSLQLPAARQENTVTPLPAPAAPAVAGSAENTAGTVSVTTPVRTTPPLLQRAVKCAVYLYWLGVAVFALNLLLQLAVLFYQAYTRPVIRDGAFRIVELSTDRAPCSFGNNIFINPAKYDWDTYNQILLHEKIHIRQRHSLDIVLAELILVFQWFNPFAWLYRKELENNLEFLTDDIVLGNPGIEKSSYQLNLLKVAAPHLPLSLTTNYNQSLLKKRVMMMNTKKSNLHTMWKYFILLPVWVVLACALNQPVAVAQTTEAGHNAKEDTPGEDHFIEDHERNRFEGLWFATIKNDKVQIEFRDNEDDHRWSSSTGFLLSDLSAVPRDQKADFTIRREAGTILFNGRFDGDQGYGHYKFTPDKDYYAYVQQEKIGNVNEQDMFTFFMVNIQKDYIAMLKKNGFSELTKNELIPLAALKVDEAFIRSWKDNGYTLTAHQLVTAKSLKMDRAYVEEIRKTGYKDLSFNQLVSFKAQGINGDYINSLKKAAPTGQSAEAALPPANELSAFKAMKIDSAYIRSLAAAGYDHIPYHELTAMKSLGVTPEYIKSFSDMGYKDLSVHNLIAFKSQNITPEFIKSFESVGYKNLPVQNLSAIKAINLTPAYIKSFQDIGYTNIPIHSLIPLKSLNITPEFVKGFKDLGFDEIPVNELPALKSTGVTPEYVASMKQKGFNSKDLRKYIQLKTAFN